MLKKKKKEKKWDRDRGNKHEPAACSLFVMRFMSITSSKTQKNPDVQVETAIKINLIDYLDPWRC